MAVSVSDMGDHVYFIFMRTVSEGNILNNKRFFVLRKIVDIMVYYLHIYNLL